MKMLREKSLTEKLKVRAAHVINNPSVFRFEVHWRGLPTDVSPRRFTDRAIEGKHLRHGLARQVSALDVRDHLVKGSQLAAKQIRGLHGCYHVQLTASIHQRRLRIAPPSGATRVRPLLAIETASHTRCAQLMIQRPPVLRIGGPSGGTVPVAGLNLGFDSADGSSIVPRHPGSCGIGRPLRIQAVLTRSRRSAAASTNCVLTSCVAARLVDTVKASSLSSSYISVT